LWWTLEKSLVEVDVQGLCARERLPPDFLVRKFSFATPGTSTVPAPQSPFIPLQNLKMAINSSEKKRKRASEKHDRPSKKAAIAPVAPPLKVQFVQNPDGPAPIIGENPFFCDLTLRLFIFVD
jgi:hypothetical protein